MIKRIVTIGGGHGQPELLRYLKTYPYEISALVSPMDNGGSGGALREQYGILPPGDPRRCLLALSEHEEFYAEWWEHRFTEGDLKGHVVGNVVLASMLLKYKNFDRAHELLQVKGRVIPTSDHTADLVATLENGEVITGETHIDIPRHNADLHIRELKLSERISLSERAAEAIAAADAFVICMGDLYTSILPNLLVDGMGEAIAHTQKPVIMICNRSTKQGETQQYSNKSYLDEVNRYLGPARVTHIVMDNSALPVPPTHEAVKQESVTGVEVISADVAYAPAPQYVSGEKAAAVIHTLCSSF